MEKGTYGHLLPSMQQEVIEKWESEFDRTDDKEAH